MSERMATVLPDFLRGCADEGITVQPFMLRRVADALENLASLVAADEWTLRRMLDDLESGKTYDAINSIEIALASRGDIDSPTQGGDDAAR